MTINTKPSSVRLTKVCASLALVSILSACQVGDIISSVFGEEETAEVKNKHPFLIKTLNEDRFIEEFQEEMTDARLTNRRVYDELVQAASRIIAFKDHNPDPKIVSHGLPDRLDLFEGISEPILADLLFEKVRDKMDNGVSQKSLVSLGEGYRQNAMTRYKNLIYLKEVEIAEQVSAKNEERENILTELNRLVMISPTVADGHFSTKLLNSTGENIRSIVFRFQAPKGQSSKLSVDLELAAGGLKPIRLQTPSGVEQGSFVTIEHISYRSGRAIDTTDVEKEIHLLEQKLKGLIDQKRRIEVLFDRSEQEFFTSLAR